MKLCFVTIGNIKSIATMKRAFGMGKVLNTLGYQIHIILLDCYENRERANLECDSDIFLHYYVGGSVLDEVMQKTKFVKLIKPDFLFFCSFSVRNLILKFKLKRAPKILIEHSELQSCIPDNSFLKKIINLIIEYYSIFYADGLICASVYLKTVFNKRKGKLLQRIPILYSPYAFDENIVTSPLIIFDLLKQKYSNKYVILYMGTLTKNYGLFNMLESIKELKNSIPNLTLLLLGEGRHKVEAQKFVSENNMSSNVEFLGYVKEEELSSYFSIASCFISPLNDTPQDWARCPSKIYMYLPFKKPILTCNIGEPKEIFGESGFYFNTDNGDSLVQLIGEIYSRGADISLIDIQNHSWTSRTLEFNSWINQFFKPHVL